MKVVALISGGIDSPVAAYLMLKQGVDIVAVYFDNHPFADKKTIEKTEKLVKRISEVSSKRIKFYVVESGKAIGKIKKIINDRYTCIFCKRMMLKMAEKIAEKEGCDFLVTGENLGQVASQTLENMIAITPSAKKEILRPLLAMDKNETIKIAKEIGTYEISILKTGSCSALPRHPATRAKKGAVDFEKEKVDSDKTILKLMEEVVRNAKCHTY